MQAPLRILAFFFLLSLALPEGSAVALRELQINQSPSRRRALQAGLEEQGDLRSATRTEKILFLSSLNNRILKSPQNLAKVIGLLGDEGWDVRRAAVEVIGLFVQADKGFATKENLAKVIGLLGDEGWGVRRAAVEVIGLFVQVHGREILEERHLQMIQSVFEGAYPGQNASLLLESFLLFAEQDVRGLLLGSQQYVKLWIFNRLKEGQKPEDTQRALQETVLPTVRLLEALSGDFPMMGIEAKRAMDQNKAEMIRSQVDLSNFTMQVMIPHQVGQSFIQEGERAEVRVLPAPYPILVLTLQEYLKAGILDQSYDYHTSIEGEMGQEAVPLMMISFFLDLPEGKLLPFYREEGGDLGMGDIYQSYVGATVNPKTGTQEGTQTNIYDKTLGRIELWERFDKDMERKALFSLFAYASLKAPAKRTPRQERLARAYRAFKKRLQDFYIRRLNLSEEEAGILAGDKTPETYFPAGSTPRHMNKAVVDPAANALLQKMRNQSLHNAYREFIEEEINIFREEVFQEDPLGRNLIQAALDGRIADILLILREPSAQRDLLGKLFGSSASWPQNLLVLLSFSKNEEVLRALKSIKNRENDPVLHQKIRAAIEHLELDLSGSSEESSATGLEEKTRALAIAQQEVAYRFGKQVDEIVGDSTALPRGRGVVVDSSIPGALTVAQALHAAQVPVAVVEPDKEKRAGMEELLTVPVVPTVAQAVRVMEAENPIYLTSFDPGGMSLPYRIVHSAEESLGYLAGLGLLPEGAIQPLLEVSLQEARYLNELARYYQ